jgi:hypothetical protein
MKKYDFLKAIKLIEDNKENLESASLGMHEDWFWTAETIWENGEYKKELFNGDLEQEYQKYVEASKNRQPGLDNFMKVENQFDHILIAGISGSSWATPTIQLEFKDGSSKMLSCYQGDSDCSKPSYFELGCLSSEAQANIPDLED